MRVNALRIGAGIRDLLFEHPHCRDPVLTQDVLNTALTYGDALLDLLFLRTHAPCCLLAMTTAQLPHFRLNRCFETVSNRLVFTETDVSDEYTGPRWPPKTPNSGQCTRLKRPF